MLLMRNRTKTRSNLIQQQIWTFLSNSTLMKWI
jgi:hypothetical protein